MSKKKKKKKSSSKSQYDAKKKNLNSSKKSSESKKEKKVLTPEEKEEISLPAVEDTVEEATEAEESYVEPPYPAAPLVDIPYDPDFSEEDFSASVNELKAEDIKMPEENNLKKDEKKKPSKASNAVLTGLLVICVSVAVVCLFMLGKNIWGKIKGQAIYSGTEFEGFTLDDDPTDQRTLAKTGADVPLLSLFDRINAGENAVLENTTGQYSEQLSQMKASLSALKAQNDDVYGWIYAEGTNINHPIVRGDDNDYYLDHAYTKEYLPIGAIYADFTTLDVITDNLNLVIYGHNVVSSGQSSMFHDVEKFLDEEVFNSTNIYIYTMDGAFVFKPVAIYPTVADDFYFKTGFNNEAEFVAYANERVTKSTVYSSETFSSGDMMLTLSTCTNGAQNGRYALHGKLIEIIK